MVLKTVANDRCASSPLPQRILWGSIGNRQIGDISNKKYNNKSSENGMSAEWSSSSFDRGSQLRGPRPKALKLLLCSVVVLVVCYLSWEHMKYN
ncbi:hypothetical protein TNCV_2058291 [Trichonephila clavipes]|nr:hypothetical protein TNCV_2058291 [Trichonephila clavipes]